MKRNSAPVWTLDFSRRWIYWLDKNCPEPSAVPSDGQVVVDTLLVDTLPLVKRFRVSVVLENNAGHYPIGAGKEVRIINGKFHSAKEENQEIYWDEQTCFERNEARGINEEEQVKIVISAGG